MSRFPYRFCLSCVAVIGVVSCGQGEMTEAANPSALEVISIGAQSVVSGGASWSALSPDESEVQARPVAQRSYVPNRVIVKLREGATGGASGLLSATPLDRERHARVLLGRRATLRELRVIAPSQRGSDATRSEVQRLTLDLAANTSIEQLAAELASNADVEWAEPDWIYKAYTTTPNDPGYAMQWHLGAIGAEQAWDRVTGRRDVTVAVIDTGVDWQHPDLAANVWRNSDEVADDGIDNDGNGYTDDVRGWDFVSVPTAEVAEDEDGEPADNDPSDVYGHGTYVAGIACGDGNNGTGFAGVSWRCSVMALRAGYKSPYNEGLFNSSDIAQALYYAADNGARVINMSFGGTELSHVIRMATDYAVGKGAFLIAAAGNSSTSVPSYPAANAGVFAVAALNSSDVRSVYSSYGEWVDIAAPGDDIVGPFPGGQYAMASGTSAAAPVVSGVAALMLAAHPGWSSRDLAYQLSATAQNLDETQVAAYRGKIGAGKVSAPAAVGARASGPNVRLLAFDKQEASGDIDEELAANEHVTFAVTIKGVADDAPAVVRLATTDSWLTVVTGEAKVDTVAFDGVATVRLLLHVNEGVPADHSALINITAQAGEVTRTWPIYVMLAPSWRKPERLPKSVKCEVLPYPGGGVAIVTDNFDSKSRHSIVATIRDHAGRFSPWFELTDERYAYADGTSAVVAVDGSIHVAYQRYLQEPHQAPQVFYRAYDAATSQWGDEEQITTDATLAWWNTVAPEIGVDASGKVHIAWFDLKGANPEIISVSREDDGWQPHVVASLPAPQFWTRMTMLQQGDAMLSMLFQYDTLYDYAEPFLLTTWNGNEWSTPVTVTGLDDAQFGQEPVSVAGEVYIPYHPTFASKSVLVARLNGTQWQSERTLFDYVATKLGSGLSIDRDAEGHIAATAGFTSSTGYGSTRMDYDLTQSSPVVSFIGTHEYYVALSPRVTLDSVAAHHVTVHEYAPFGTQFLVNSHTGYHTRADRLLSEVPTRPLVVDGGDATNLGTEIHARWSSSSPTGIAYYETAVGSTPGGSDVVGWSRNDANEATFSLVDTPMEPGKTYYVAVRAVSAAVYASTTGWSDGIRYIGLPRCDAPAWQSNILYEEAATRVTHKGVIYRWRYWNYGQEPGTNAYGPWARVAVCTGEPPVPSCIGDVWEATRVYTGGEIVARNGHIWQSKWYNVNNEPKGGSNSPWKWLGLCK